MAAKYRALCVAQSDLGEGYFRSGRGVFDDFDADRGIVHLMVLNVAAIAVAAAMVVGKDTRNNTV